MQSAPNLSSRTAYVNVCFPSLTFPNRVLPHTPPTPRASISATAATARPARSAEPGRVGCFGRFWIIGCERSATGTKVEALDVEGGSDGEEGGGDDDGSESSDRVCPLWRFPVGRRGGVGTSVHSHEVRRARLQEVRVCAGDERRVCPGVVGPALAVAILQVH